jgi:rod shape-determining protein MreC
MIADFRYHTLGYLRGSLNFIVSPLQYLVDYPVHMAGWLQSLMSTKKSLIDENIQLRYQQTILDAKLQKLRILRNENAQLKELLSASSSEAESAMAAEILAVDTTSSRQIFVLNKGNRDGVYVGQPVLDAKGITGQIIDVGIRTSTVLLISDSKSAVPVRNNRTGERAILIGANSMSELLLINLPKSSSISKGDLLVTSGLGRLYPEGYPVGRVKAIKTIAGDDFIKVTVSPVAQLNRSRLVLLISPNHDYVELTKQIDERIKIIDSGSYP